MLFPEDLYDTEGLGRLPGFDTGNVKGRRGFIFPRFSKTAGETANPAGKKFTLRRCFPGNLPT